MNKEAIMSELRKVVYGKDDVLEKIIMCLLANGHVLMEDVPGVGKTTIAKAFSKVLDLDFNRLQFTSDVMPSDILGFDAYKGNGELVYQEGPVFCNVFLADEINRTSPKSQSALLEVMEEKQVSIGKETRILDNPFFVMATQNPFGTAGINMLPQSQMDRFMCALSIGYPSRTNEIDILKSRSEVDPLVNVKKVVDKQQLLQMKKEVEAVYVDDAIYEYIIDLAICSRNFDKIEEIEVGISPRGSLAIMRLAKAKAYMEGRNYVIPSDVTSMLADCWAHRLVLTTHDPRCVSLEKRRVVERILEIVKEPPLKKKRD